MKFDIEQFNPCNEALKYYNSKKSTIDAWNDCDRGDWMLWIAKKLDIDLRKLTLAKALCAKKVLHLMKDERSVNAVSVAEKFGRGEASIDELSAAYAAAYAAADTAAYAAASAAADAAADAAAYAADADARKKMLLECADICKDILTKEVFKKI